MTQYLDARGPEVAHIARERCGCLTPWQRNPAAYGRAALIDDYRSCEQDVVEMLRTMLSERIKVGHGNGGHLFDARQNARLIANVEA